MSVITLHDISKDGTIQLFRHLFSFSSSFAINNLHPLFIIKELILLIREYYFYEYNNSHTPPAQIPFPIDYMDIHSLLYFGDSENFPSRLNSDYLGKIGFLNYGLGEYFPFLICHICPDKVTFGIIFFPDFHIDMGLANIGLMIGKQYPEFDHIPGKSNPYNSYRSNYTDKDDDNNNNNKTGENNKTGKNNNNDKADKNNNNNKADKDDDNNNEDKDDNSNNDEDVGDKVCCYTVYLLKLANHCGGYCGNGNKCISVKEGTCMQLLKGDPNFDIRRSKTENSTYLETTLLHPELNKAQVNKKCNISFVDHSNNENPYVCDVIKNILLDWKEYEELDKVWQEDNAMSFEDIKHLL